MPDTLMPVEQLQFIKDLQNHFLEHTNMTKHEAWDVGFAIWNNKVFLFRYLLRFFKKRKEEREKNAIRK